MGEGRWQFYRGYEITKVFYDESQKVRCTITSDVTSEYKGMTIWDLLEKRVMNEIDLTDQGIANERVIYISFDIFKTPGGINAR